MKREDSIYAMRFASQQMLIDKLEQQCQKQKEVIDKLIEYLQEKYDSSGLCGIVLNFTEFEDIKDLLKEVSE